MTELEQRIKIIENRNKKVELDKAWETSWTRRLSVAVLTYAVVVLYLIVIKNSAPFVNALVPAIGFILSTLLMKSIRKIWEKQ